MFDRKSALQPVIREPVKPNRYWMRFVREHFTRPADSLPPRGVALLERSWHRQSALIMYMHETKKDG